MDNFLDNKLNEPQKTAVLSDSKNILVTAGAGSGKTRVLTERILKLINCRYINPEEILAITFTNKASNVMKERLREKGLNVSKLWISTFHSSCVRILRENARFLDGYNSDFTIYDEADKNKLISQILKNEQIEDDKFKKNLGYHISYFKNKNQTYDEYLNNNCFERNIEEYIKYIKIYEQKMKENNAFDFDDLLQKTLILLLNNKEVLSYYQNKFKHILVDEFQDTNEIQYDLVKLLAGANTSVFVVGDEDQCIYSWRGANYKNISNFTKDFEKVEIIKLEQNYRSSKKIINCANKIISKNIQRIDKNLWTDNDEGVNIEYKKCYNEGEEANYIASNIFSLKNNLNYNYNYNDIAVLVRLNSLTRNIEEKLLNYGISYKVYGGMKFYDRLEIKNFLSYLKVLNNIKDDVSFSKIANWPKRSIGEATIESLKNLNTNQSMFENLLDIEKYNLKSATYNKLLSLRSLLKDLLEQKEKLGLVDFVNYVITKIDLKNYLDKEEEDKNRMLNIEQLVLSIEEFVKNNNEASLSDYLQSVTLISDIDNYNENDDSVTIATVHASKGLEFKVVFVIGLEEGIFPLIRQDTDCDEEEERRLMYVAVTRGMERLYLSWAENRFIYGYTRREIISPYLKDLGYERPEFDNNYSTEYKVRSYGYDKNSCCNYNSNYYKNNYNNNDDLKDFSMPDNRQIKSATEIQMNTVNDKNYTVGDKVRHTKYGDGIITSISGGIGKIMFKGVGVKELMLDYAPLTKI